MLLSAEHLSINFGSRQLLDDVNLYLNEGDKVGVIGINGTGKSTFLKVLSGVTEPDGGTISRNPNVQISLLPQNPVMDEDATVLASEWCRPDGRHVYIVVNMGDKDRRVTLPGVDKPFVVKGASCRRLDL